MTLGVRVLSFLVGYVFGMIPSGYLFGKSRHVDITKQGSGNIGTTNTLRVLGKFYGLMTLFCDAAKAIVPAAIMYFIFGKKAGADPHLVMLYAATGAVIGHDFPAVMKFKGGKGIATCMGLFMICFPQCLPLSFLLFAIALVLTGYVSLGSILCAAAFPVQVLVFWHFDLLFFKGSSMMEAFVLSVFLGGLAIARHHSNISRLYHGNENKFSLHSKKEA